MKPRLFLLALFLLANLSGFAKSDLIDSLYQTRGDSADGDYFNGRGKELYNLGYYELAIEAYSEAIDLYVADNDSAGMARVYNRTGLAYNRMAKGKEAVEALLVAAQINQDLGNVKGLADNNFNLGNYFARSSVYDKAYAYLLAAMKGYEELENKRMSAGVANTLGTVFYEEQYENYNLDSAEYYLTLSSEGFKSLKAEGNLTGLGQNFGMLEEKRNNYGKAMEYYQATRDKFIEYEDDFQVMNINMNIGNLYMDHLRNTEESLKYFEEGFDIAREIDNKRMILSFAEQLVKAHLTLENSKAAQTYFIEYDKVKEQVYDSDVSRQIAEMDAYYRKDRMEQELDNQIVALNQKEFETRLILATLAIVLVLTALMIIFYTQRQKVVRQLAAKQTKLHHQEVNKMLQDHELERMNAMINGQEKERYRIATDLHDRLGSTLSAVKLHVNAYLTLQVAGEDYEIEEQRDRLGELLDRAVGEVRDISHDMLSGVLTKFGLSAALEDLKETLESSRQYRVHLQIINLHDRVDNTLELHLYRIVQELVSNIMKHARASMITIQLNKLDDELILMVEDDGIGFAPEHGKGEGVGLQNVADRVRSLGGHLHVDTQPGRGATITVEIPTT